ncbi:hypothetical protein [Sphingosinicella sp. BN140058]|uniref:hypothetical protein n=1 Tax=Sphingosinicella sp. BN140058 TaxID=1892855 RepID=UPI001011B146|nr:hypothetical protein [Sphingosinicella sp. BN140058]QAY76781.1 hypothetical protein ETR14_09945 [Sphingosinicella sp. BN140058]
MMRWLDALGWAKWPSLLLIASPIAAYSSWLPDEGAADACGIVSVEGSRFRVQRREDGAFLLRPTREERNPAVVLAAVKPIGFDSGAMIVTPEDGAVAGIACRPVERT